ncbi:DUF945 family protein, partial [Escherichia coli]
MIRKSATGVIVALAVIWGGGTWYTGTQIQPGVEKFIKDFGNDSNLLIVFYVQIMPDDFVMQLH